LRPLYRDAGRPLWESFGETTFAQARMPGTAPRNFDMYHELSDPVIAAAIDAVPEANAVEIRHWGGAMSRPAADAGPVGHRDVPFSIIVDGPSDVADQLRPYGTGGSFLNFLADPSQVETAYTAADFARLRSVKAAVDPTNVFHVNLNIAPAKNNLARNDDFPAGGSSY